ncbi:lipase family protein [Leucobacter sp. gxy201]|uniref:lipase family protein n=1 Tax=Leucobacter sp. gxy201 TaxID=2957200 RepID=UPI003DA1C197
MASASLPLRIVLAVIAVATGAALILAPLAPHETAVIAGVGFAIVGVALLLRAHRDREITRAALFTARIVGAVMIAAGAVVAVVPALGATWVAFLIAASVVVHGLLSALRALRGDSPYRAAEIITAAAGIVFGLLAFTWPVLTLTMFRFAVGAWFVFVGLRLLFELLVRQGSSRTRAGSNADGRAVPSAPRRWARGIGAGVALATALLLAAGSAVLLGGARLPEPDAFYTAPAEVPEEPGMLIRSEPLTTGVPSGAQAWRILYTTTHPDGSPAVSSGTVIAPASPGAAPLPLLTVAHGTTGVVPKCAPSLSAAPFADGAGTALAEMVTEHGWVAVTSDYIGLGTSGPHPYLVGDAEARNVLDASRAVQQFDRISTTTETVVWGHSQGGQGALWTGQIAADYAPELTIKGVAAFAPAADLYGLAEADKDDAAGKTVSAYIASTWNKLYPELELEQHLTPGSAGGVDRIQGLCFNGRDVLGAVVSGTQIPNQVFPDRLLDGPFGDELKAQEPVGPWPAPVLVAQGLADPLVKPEMQLDWVQARCTAGEQIDYRTYPGLSHNTLVAADSPLTPEIVQWTLDRWGGEPATPDCSDLPNSVAD